MKTQIITLLCCCFSILGFNQSITDMEYFFNTDPGFGIATPITVNTNTGSVTQIDLQILVGNSLTGFNTLYVRAKDNAGVWGLNDGQVFYITKLENSASNIMAAEYFFNDYDGFGNETTIIPIDSNSGLLTQTITIPVGSNQTGFNTLYIRTQDNLGLWSLYDRRIFYITETNASNIVAAEYFFNNDPGIGGGTSININPIANEITEDLSLTVNSLNGFNTLYVRTQDDLGVWSLYDRQLFYVSEDLVLANITGAEYFYDSEPSFGNGTAATLIPTGNPDEYTVELATTDVTCDFHDFYIRVQNSNGKWSLYGYGLDVEVFDNADPTIVVFPNIIAELDASGNASIMLADVDNGTFDDCELVSVVLNQTQFDYSCTNLGENTVTITATDAEAKVSNEDVTITVVDLINPVAITKNITVQLDGNGDASITPAQIQNGSTDNCSVTGFSLDVSSFTCANVGANTVSLTVSDSSGNLNSASAMVTVEDNINPMAIGMNITVYLEGNPFVTIVPAEVDNGSSDNCGGFNLSLDVDTFNSEGVYPVTLTITDSSGNVDSVGIMVTVEATLSIDESEDLAKEILLYPIPAKYQLNISSSLQIKLLEVFDINGKLVTIYKKPCKKIDVSRYASGLYFLKFNVDDIVVSKRFIKK